MQESRTQRFYKTIMLVVIVAIITFMITTICVYNYMIDNKDVKYLLVSDKNTQTVDINTKLSAIKKVLDEEYLGDIDEEKLIDGAIKGYVDGVGDEYTEYFTKDEMEKLMISVEGDYVGIGIYMTLNNSNQIVVLTPIKGSPAYDAGILPGDIIKKVDDIEYSGEEMSEAAAKIKGEEGTKVELVVERDGNELTFDVERKSIDLNHVESKVLENNIGYIQISTFDDGCSDEFEEELKKLKNENINSLIIDMRNNGGGIVKEALSIADMLIEKDKTLLITVDKNEKEEVSYSKSKPVIDGSIKIVVLVNGNSASATEILSGALKDNQRAQIVGETTYGKGVIQNLMKLKDGAGLKITTEEYFTPLRNKINKVGITPDLEVKQEKNSEQDIQLQKAIELLK